MPEKPQSEDLCARLCQSPAERARSLFDARGMKSTDFGEGIKLLAAINDRNPEMLQGIELSDSRDIPVPIRKAILDRILQDPGDHADVLRALHTKGGMNFDPKGRMAAFYQLISDQEPILHDMLHSLRKGLTSSGSIDGMNAAEQRTLIMLRSLSHKEPAQSEFRDILLPARLQRQYFCSFNSREWAKLRDIFQSVGGETHFELALQVYHYVEEMAQAGVDRKKALAHALRCASLGADPHATPMEDGRTASPAAPWSSMTIVSKSAA